MGLGRDVQIEGGARPRWASRAAGVLLATALVLGGVTYPAAADVEAPEPDRAGRVAAVLESSVESADAPAEPMSDAGAATVAASVGSSNVLAAGRFHTCAVNVTATISCWGESGAIGGASDPPPGSFRQVAAGSGHTCAIRVDATLTCWGNPAFAPAGTFTSLSAGNWQNCAVRTDGTATCWGFTQVSTAPGGFAGPAPTPPTGVFVDVSAGTNHGCGLRPDDSVTCWGGNSVGQASPPAGAFSRVSAGNYFSCGVQADGTLACWGQNSDGQTSPPAGSFVDVTTGQTHACAIKADGGVVCWGSNVQGESTPSSGVFVAVSAGEHHTCAAQTDGSVSCWGGGGVIRPPFAALDVAAGSFSACGLDPARMVVCAGLDGSGQSSPPSGASAFTKVDVASTHACGVRTDGTVECWGDSWGVAQPTGTFVDVSAGDSVFGHTCGVRTGGAVDCWGHNLHGQANDPPGEFTSVSTGQQNTCGLRTDSTVHCWGASGAGQTTVPSGTFTEVSTGTAFACGLRPTGPVECWGDNSVGQAAPPSGTFTSVDAGARSACGVRSDGTLACWGANGNGRLATPSGLFLDVSVGGNLVSPFMCGLRIDSTVNCWGRFTMMGESVRLFGEPFEPSNVRVWPTRIGTTGSVTLRVIGRNLSEGQVTLVGPDGRTVSAQDVHVAAPLVLEARFGLDGIPPGRWEVHVQPPTGESFVAGEVVADPPAPQELQVSLQSRDRLRAGVESTVVVTVTNPGNVDAEVVPVYLDGLPEGTEVGSRFDEIVLSHDLFPDGLLPGIPVDHETAEATPPTVSNDDGTVAAPVLVSRVPAHGTVSIPMSVRLPTTSAPPSFPLRAWANQCLGGVDLPISGVLAALDSAAACALAAFEAAVSIGLTFVPGASCTKSGWETFTALRATSAASTALFGTIKEARGTQVAWGSKATNLVLQTGVTCALDAAATAFPAARLVTAGKLIWRWGRRTNTALEGANGCLGQSAVATRTVSTIAAWDPNEKVGPPGSGEEGFTTPDVPFDYTIFFENLDTATAPAQVVRVTDPIDVDRFDPSTIRLGPIVVGGSVIAEPPPGTRDWATVVPVEGIDEPVGIDVTWDDSNSTLTWTLTTLDPDTLELTEEPEAGFLPPNVDAPEGEGSVSFFIEPRERTDGIELANSASIVFDANEAIVTDTWRNTLDGTDPHSAVESLPSTTTDETFEVSWGGDDEWSGIDSYEVWAQVDDTPPVLWGTFDGDVTSAAYSGAPGHTYAFWSVARDRAGNKETAPTAPDAVTTVVEETPAPTVTAVSPSSGPVTGGTSVTITGTDLTGATAVTFGDVAATSFTVDSPTSITATTPAHPAGSVDVLVTTDGGASPADAHSRFTFVEPDPGAVGHELSISITGAYDYAISGAVSGGDIKVDRDAFGVRRVKGRAQVGSAEVAVDVQRLWIFPAYVGEVVVTDLEAGLRRVRAPVLVDRLETAGEPGRIGSAASWFVVRPFLRLQPYRIEWSVTEHVSPAE